MIKNIFKRFDYKYYDKKYLVIYLIILLFVIFILSIYFSRAYFSTRIVGNPKSLEITTELINIDFGSSNPSLLESDLNTSWSSSRTFSVTNNTTSPYTYNIIIKNLVNLYPVDVIQYKLICTSNNFTSSYFSNMTEFEEILQVRQNSDYPLGYNISIPAGVTQTFSLDFRYNPNESTYTGTVFQGEIALQPGIGISHIANLYVTKGSSTVGTSISAVEGSTVTMPIDKSGYSTENAVISGAGCSFDTNKNNVIISNVSENITCNVTGLTPNSFTVNYVANGASNNMSSTTCTYDSNCSLRSNTLTRVGYSFSGWKDSLNRFFPNSANVKNIISEANGVLNLTAQWTPINYTIGYNCNKGAGNYSNSVHKYGVSKSLNASECNEGTIIEGNSGSINDFIGWSTNPNATTATYYDGQSVKNLANTANARVILYAVYGNIFTLTGNYLINEEYSTGNWNLIIYGSTGQTSGNVSVTLNSSLNIDMFLLSGGSNGESGIGENNCGAYSYCGGDGGSGGSGGSYKTYNNLTIIPGNYTIVIGSAGNASSAFNYSSRDSGASPGASGGGGGSMTGYGNGACYSVTNGNAGGAGIQAFGGVPANYFAAGGGGGGGVNAYNNCFGTGFAPNGEGNARGAGGAGGSSVGGTGGLGGHSGNPAVANSGSGGGGGGGPDAVYGSAGGAGGSGIIIIRNHR